MSHGLNLAVKTITLSLASTENRRRAGIKLATGANALDTAKAIKAKLAELQPFFPQGMKVLYPYDTTPSSSFLSVKW
ncbi:hypothetical protein DMI60_06285 [Escherichia coli]|nr:hypothetical protein [Escherichia coli]